MAKRKIELFIEINNEKEFENALKHNCNQLICAEIYCTFAGSCSALDKLFTTIKLDWSNGKMVLLKVPADEIEAFERFRNHSEPVFMFILNYKTTKVFRGVDSLRFADVAKRELGYFNDIAKGVEFDRLSYELHEPTPDEDDWIRKKSIARLENEEALFVKRAARQAARKLHRAELMIPFLENLNFVLYWPHCFHAHPELYEKWDMNNIIMVGREEIELTEETARDVLYAGDAPLNEASLLQLLAGPSLAICFRLLDTEKHFVSLVRKILYEEIPVKEESKPANERPRVTAFNQYKTFSPTREQVVENRRRDKIRKKEETLEKRARRLSEMQRLARQDIEDTLEAQRLAREQKRLELLKSGNLTALREFDQEPDEEINIDIPEELPDPYVEEESDEEVDDYLPPPGLLIPGFYSPPNDVAKVNGLAILFQKSVYERVTPEPEFLPPHVLVMLEIAKRYKAIQAMSLHKKYIIHMGIFEGTTPSACKNLAYSVKQYDTLGIDSTNEEDLRLAFMLSVEKDIPLLQLMDLIPVHVSRDASRGGDECAMMFAVDYGDNYPELEDFDEVDTELN